MNRSIPLLILACAASFAAQAAESGMQAGALAHALDRVASTGRVLYVAAHPDDENTRLLGYLANGRHLTAAYLSITRGGGGQNLIGSEQGELLDVIRTEELLAARRIDGAVQRFTRMRDFGYSKSATEALAIWDHEQALADVVQVIRSFQPDVIITRFDENPPNHGHHTASAILAREAFSAAADPKRFPEQLTRGLKPWQADRLLRNLSTWRNETIPPDALALDVGAYDPRLGYSFGELAALSRSQHKSQGFGVPGERGGVIERFGSIAGTKPEKELFEGLELGWGRYGAAAAPLVRALEAAQAALDRDHPERAIPALLDAHRAFDALPDDVRVRDGKRALELVIGAAAGLFVRCHAAQPVVAPGGEVALTVEVVLRRPAAITLRRIVPRYGSTIDAETVLQVQDRKKFEQKFSIAADAAISTPYWLSEAPHAGSFRVADPALIGEPSTPPALSVELELQVGDRAIRLTEPVVHGWVDPVHGERLRPVLIVPPATVTPAREAVLFPNNHRAELALQVRAGRDRLEGEVSLLLPAGWRSEPATHTVKLAKSGDESTLSFQLLPPAGATRAVAVPRFSADGKSWSFREATIDYPHIPLQLVLQPAAVKLVPLRLAVPSGVIGYVRGSGDTVADDLRHVGLAVEALDDQVLKSGDLSRFAAIVIGIRAYNTRDAVRVAHPRLMSYVESGGVVVTQYNTNNWIGPMEHSVGPFPLEIGRDRITDEKASMTVLQPDHPMLKSPNEITAVDFDGWVQERGIYFASTWDERYVPLFAASDPGEKPLSGSTLVATHGKGRFVYTGLAFFRQLPAGVPGAYRLFVNLLNSP